jgi:hypothetical protein
MLSSRPPFLHSQYLYLKALASTFDIHERHSSARDFGLVRCKAFVSEGGHASCIV